MDYIYRFNALNSSLSSTFQENYKCYPIAALSSKSTAVVEDLDTGGKIILPPSTLGKLTRLNISYPMLFEISTYSSSSSSSSAAAAAAAASSSLTKQKSTHAGVLEFVAEEGCAYIPHWIMVNLGIEVGSIVNIKSAQLPTCTFVKFQPQSVNFLDISNPKAVLEKFLRNFACLTTGDIISMHYNNKTYELLVMEVKPGGKGVCIIECDMEVDFAAPKGYTEPVPIKKQEQLEEDMVQRASLTQSPSGQTVLSLPEEDFVKFKAFTGLGARLDGKKKGPSPSSSPAKGLISPQQQRATSGSFNSNSNYNSGTSSPSPTPQVVGIPWKKNKITFIRTTKTKSPAK